MISAITLSPQAQRVGLHFMLLGDNENFHGEEVVLFLQQLKGEVGGPWTIVWDRGKIHSKAKVVKAWLAKLRSALAGVFCERDRFTRRSHTEFALWSHPRAVVSGYGGSGRISGTCPILFGTIIAKDAT